MPLRLRLQPFYFIFLRKGGKKEDMPEFPQGSLYSTANKTPARSYPYTHKASVSGSEPAANVIRAFPSRTSPEVVVLAAPRAELWENKEPNRSSPAPRWEGRVLTEEPSRGAPKSPGKVISTY